MNTKIMDMYKYLDQFWHTGFSIVLFIIGLFVVNKLQKKNNEPISATVVNWCLFIVLIYWFFAYLFATRYELDAMSIAFPEIYRPQPNFLVLLMSVSLAVGFCILILFHRNTFIVAPAILAMGFVDLYGNSTLASGMQTIAQNIIIDGNKPTPPQAIWFDYYLVNWQLQRVQFYMVISMIALLLSFLSLAKFLDTKKVELIQSDFINKTITSVIKRNSAISLTAKLLIIGVICFNETVMWGWRIERETALRTHCASLYFAWLPSDSARVGSENSLCSRKK